MRINEEGNDIDDVFVQLLKGAVAFGIVLFLTKTFILALVAFVFAAAGLPEVFNKKDKRKPH